MHSASKVVVLFVEGDTEEVFYSKLCAMIRKTSNKPLEMDIDIYNVKGVGGFKNQAYKTLKYKMNVKYKNKKVFVACCFDSDVFEFAEPINWNVIDKSLKSLGALKVLHIIAIRSIEDWFLKDIDGIKKFLNPKGWSHEKISMPTGGRGYDKMIKLFRQHNKQYFKGRSCVNMVDCLNIELIVKDKEVSSALNEFYNLLGV